MSHLQQSHQVVLSAQTQIGCYIYHIIGARSQLKAMDDLWV